MKEKRIRKGLLLLMMAAALLLCGCETTQKRPVEITLIHGWGSIAGDHEAMRQIYSDFSKENPDIKIIIRELILLNLFWRIIHFYRIIPRCCL